MSIPLKQCPSAMVPRISNVPWATPLSIPPILQLFTRSFIKPMISNKFFCIFLVAKARWESQRNLLLRLVNLNNGCTLWWCECEVSQLNLYVILEYTIWAATRRSCWQTHLRVWLPWRNIVDQRCGDCRWGGHSGLCRCAWTGVARTSDWCELSGAHCPTFPLWFDRCC